MEGHLRGLDEAMASQTQERETKPDVEVWWVDTNRFHFIACNSEAQDWMEEHTGHKGDALTISEIVVSSWSGVLELATEMVKAGMVVEPRFTQLTMSMLEADIQANKRQADVFTEYLANAQKQG